MRTLIRDLKTGMFYGSDGHWTAERDDARDFGGTYQAMSFASQQQLRGIQLHLAFEIPEHDVIINLDREQPSPETYRDRTGNDS
jgi:hypothetical protein